MSLATRYEDSRRKLKLELNCVKFQVLVLLESRRELETIARQRVDRLFPLFDHVSCLFLKGKRVCGVPTDVLFYSQREDSFLKRNVESYT